jgi:hypothetical protein
MGNSFSKTHTMVISLLFCVVTPLSYNIDYKYYPLILLCSGIGSVCHAIPLLLVEQNIDQKRSDKYMIMLLCILFNAICTLKKCKSEVHHWVPSIVGAGFEDTLKYTLSKRVIMLVGIDTIKKNQGTILIITSISAFCYWIYNCLEYIDSTRFFKFFHLNITQCVNDLKGYLSGITIVVIKKNCPPLKLLLETIDTENVVIINLMNTAKDFCTELFTPTVFWSGLFAICSCGFIRLFVDLIPFCIKFLKRYPIMDDLFFFLLVNGCLLWKRLKKY